MCSNLANKKPGSLFPIRTVNGNQPAFWGMNNGYYYNARLDKLNTTWHNWSKQRGIIEVRSFTEKNGIFVKDDGSNFKIGVIYNNQNEFSVLTTQSEGVIAAFHHRQPLLLAESAVEAFLSTEQLYHVITLNQNKIKLHSIAA